MCLPRSVEEMPDIERFYAATARDLDRMREEERVVL
jgi:hypothetical protein